MKIPKRKLKVCIYIDGSNFYHYLKDKEISFSKGKKFDYSKFIDFLVGEKRKCISKRYYTGIFKNRDGTDKSAKLVKNQQRFIASLENEGFTVKKGKIIYDNEKPREKGTDVKIAVDLVTGAIDNHYDLAILVSSDTDLIPAIQYARYKKKRIEYVGFSHAPSFGIQKNADISRLLLPEDIEKFKTNW